MMIMTTWQGVVTIIMAILGTMLTRFLPFLVFPESKEPPRFITYLGTVLPYAMTGLLVVYSLKGVHLLSGSHGIPELLGDYGDRSAARMEKKHAAVDRRWHRCSTCCWCSWYSIKLLRNSAAFGRVAVGIAIIWRVPYRISASSRESRTASPCRAKVRISRRPSHSNRPKPAEHNRRGANTGQDHRRLQPIAHPNHSAEHRSRQWRRGNPK